MPTLSKPLAPVKSRRCRLQRHPDTGALLLFLTVDGHTKGYLLREVSASFGRGFTLERSPIDVEQGEDKAYTVNLESADVPCTCPGGSYRGDCKHAAAIRELVRQGKL